MKRVTSLTVLATFLTVPAFAQTALTGVVGYDPAEVIGGTNLAVSSVKDGNYTVIIGGAFAVSFEELKDVKAIRGPLKDPASAKNVWHYALPADTQVYAFGLGREWGSMSADLGKIDLAKVLATGKVVDGVATLDFKKIDGERCRAVTWVVQFPGGQRAWGAHPAGWTAKNVRGAPLTLWCFDGDKVAKAPKDVVTALAGQK